MFDILYFFLAEYDKIEGTSEHTDAGVAPQQSVVGILDGAGGAAGAGVGGGSGASFGGSGIGAGSGISSSFVGSSTAAKSSAYLPPAGH